MEYLTLDDVLLANKEGIDRFGGIYIALENNVKNHNSLAYLIEQVTRDDYYPTILDCAVFYIEKIAGNQIFHDGNKRTALTALNIFLDLNSWQLKNRLLPAINKNGLTIPRKTESDTDSILIRFMEEIGAGELDADDIRAFLQENIEPITPTQ
jgi:prophage maintenance system killer protein